MSEPRRPRRTRSTTSYVVSVVSSWFMLVLSLGLAGTALRPDQRLSCPESRFSAVGVRLQDRARRATGLVGSMPGHEASRLRQAGRHADGRVADAAPRAGKRPRLHGHADHVAVQPGGLVSRTTIPPMPEIVAHGKEATGFRACAICHYPNGQGLMQNAPVAGLPVDYFLRQIEEFANGRRKSADVNKANAFEMAAMARNLTPAEAKAAADYFGSMPFKPWIRVIESDDRAAVHGDGQRAVPEGRRQRHRAARAPHRRDAGRRLPDQHASQPADWDSWHMRRSAA